MNFGAPSVATQYFPVVWTWAPAIAAGHRLVAGVRRAHGYSRQRYVHQLPHANALVAAIVKANL